MSMNAWVIDWKYSEYDGQYLKWWMSEMSSNWYVESSQLRNEFVTGTLAVL